MKTIAAALLAVVVSFANRRVELVSLEIMQALDQVDHRAKDALIEELPASMLADTLAALIAKRLDQVGVFDVRPWIERSPDQRDQRDRAPFSPRHPGREKQGWAPPRRSGPAAGGAPGGKPFRAWGAEKSRGDAGGARAPLPGKAATGRFGRRPAP